MSSKSNGLSDDDLWAKCQQSGSISSQDLGLNIHKDSDGTTYMTEGQHTGTRSLQFELCAEDKE